jgi:putative glycerol-1-phosphate prenyltransferase
MTDYQGWRTILKLDPARSLNDERLREVCSWPVDALIVGGSGGYGSGEVAGLLARLEHCSLPLAQEVSDLDALCPGFDLYLVPMVLNSREVDWIVGYQQAALKRLGPLVDLEEVVGEGYLILNPTATAAQLSKANVDLDSDDVVAFARLAEGLLRLPIFYLEYSGTYGSPEVVRASSAALHETLLWYGGGIRTAEQAGEMGAAADAIVIGNAIYEGCSPFG